MGERPRAPSRSSAAAPSPDGQRMITSSASSTCVSSRTSGTPAPAAHHASTSGGSSEAEAVSARALTPAAPPADGCFLGRVPAVEGPATASNVWAAENFCRREEPPPPPPAEWPAVGDSPLPPRDAGEARYLLRSRTSAAPSPPSMSSSRCDWRAAVSDRQGAGSAEAEGCIDSIHRITASTTTASAKPTACSTRFSTHTRARSRS